jgi:serine/threonine protein kinase
MIISPVAKCDLLKSMEERAPTPDFLRLLRTFPGCLATALEYLHREGIRHEDIKTSNILVNGCNVLFTDFGISRDCDNTRATTSENPGRITLRYSAPEVAEYSKRSFPSDLWSLGCVSLEIFTIVRGESLSKLCSFFQNNGTKMKAYCQNQKAISGWIAHLQNAQVDEENDEPPFKWINQLLQSDVTKRLSARTLATRITSHVSVAGLTGEFCGLCCRFENFEAADAE